MLALLVDDSLHCDPEESPDVSLVADDGDAVDQGHGVGQVGEVHEGAADQAEPGIGGHARTVDMLQKGPMNIVGNNLDVLESTSLCESTTGIFSWNG